MKDQLKENIQNLSSLLSDTSFHSRVDETISIVSESLKAGLPLLVFGNGGSASDALHISGELVGKFFIDRKSLNVICLNGNVTVLTAWTNDVDYETVFSRQIEAHGTLGGVAWGLSTSGNSPSVVTGLSVAKSLGLATIAMTGLNGGKAAKFADVLLNVPAELTPRIQELHLPVYHYICQEIEKNCK